MLEIFNTKRQKIEAALTIMKTKIAGESCGFHATVFVPKIAIMASKSAGLDARKKIVRIIQSAGVAAGLNDPATNAKFRGFLRF